MLIKERYLKARMSLIIVLIMLMLVSLPGSAMSMTFRDINTEKTLESIELKAINRNSLTGVKQHYQQWKLRSLISGANVSKTPLSRPVDYSAVKLDSVQPAARTAISLKKSLPGWEIRFHQNSTPALIKADKLFTREDAAGKLPGLSARSLSPNEVALACLEEYKELLKIRRPSEEFKEKSVLRDALGLKHIKYQQVYQGLPVWGKELVVHVDQDGDVYQIDGKIEPTTTLATAPQLTAPRVLDKMKDSLGEQAQINAAELVIYVDGRGTKILAYHVEACIGFERWQFFIDATTGNVLEKYNDTWYGGVAAAGADLSGQQRNFSAWEQGGTYYMIDTTLPGQSRDPVIPDELGQGNIIVVDACHQEPDYLNSVQFVNSMYPDRNWDPAAVSVVHNFLTINDYYWDRFNRNGIDGSGMNSIGVIHVGDQWENACWTGQYMFFGDGWSTFDSLAKSLDIAAHEYTHGVVEFTAGLEYKYQSGALNEAYADIFGCMVDRDDWLIGEEITKESPGFLRSLSNPHQGLDYLPATMDEYYNLPFEDDNGGVHYNCTIPARAAYLMAEGLTREGGGTSIGREKTEEIFYRALVCHLTRQSDFVACRYATVQSAEELYGENTPEVQAVKTAWDMVGVLDTGTGGGGGGDIPPVQGEDNILFFYTEDYWWGESLTYLCVRYADGEEYYVSSYPVTETRPVVIGDGELVLFVDIDNNLVAASTLRDEVYENVLWDTGDVRTIAGSADGRYFAFTTTNYDDKIYLMDLDDDTGEGDKIFQLYSPSLDAGQTSLLLFPDVIDFSLAGDKIVFDALNEVDFGAAQGYQFWNIGELELKTGSIQNLVPPQPEGVHIGNPAVANTRDWLIAADVIDETENICRTMTVNLAKGQMGLVAEQADCWGWPCFGGDDAYVALNQSGNIVKVPIAANGDIFEGDAALQEDIVVCAGYPEIFRIGARHVAPDIQVSASTVDFGEVDVGLSATAVVSILNAGTYDLVIDSFHLTDENNFSHNGAHQRIAPGDAIEVTVEFSPSSAGLKSATLYINSDDEDTPAIGITLTGQGNDEYELWTGATVTKDVPADKEWRVEFNLELDAASLDEHIFICEAGSGERFPVTPVLAGAPNSPATVLVLVQHTQPFAAGGSYVLYIKKGITAKNGASLSKGIKMPFTVAE